MASPRLLSLMALSLLESPSHAYEDKVLEKLSAMTMDDEARETYLDAVEREAIRLSRKRQPLARRADGRRAREFVERLLSRAAA